MDGRRFAQKFPGPCTFADINVSLPPRRACQRRKINASPTTWPQVLKEAPANAGGAAWRFAAARQWPHAAAMDIAIEHEPRHEDIRILEDLIHDFNETATGIRDGKYLALFLRDGDGRVIGGLFGWTWGATCYVRYLFVPQALRRQGYGSRLMRLVEDEAKVRGCRQIALETHDFQAPEFYRRLGFEVVGLIDGYPIGHSSLSMVKRLSP
jgi:GNAT superfamily N-acetyltransferase